MTPRLTRADATAVHLRLNTLIEKHNSISSALQEMLAVEAILSGSRALALREKFSWAACARRTLAAYRTLV